MSFDDWIAREPEPFYLSEKDLTHLDDLQRVRKRLVAAAKEFAAATKEAILPRGQTSRILNVEAETHDILADIDEELSHRQ